MNMCYCTCMLFVLWAGGLNHLLNKLDKFGHRASLKTHMYVN